LRRKAPRAASRGRFLSPLFVYIGGYGPLLCAVAFSSYIKELRHADMRWEKTEKVGRGAEHTRAMEQLREPARSRSAARAVPPTRPLARDAAFEEEIRSTVAFERKLMVRGIIAAAIVAVVVVVRTLYLS